MKNQIDKTLLALYFSGNASAATKRQIELWLENNPNHRDFFYQCLEEWEREHPKTEFDIDADFSNLTRRIAASETYAEERSNQQDRKRSPVFVQDAPAFAGQSQPVQWYQPSWQKMAAVITLLLVCGAVFFFLQSQQTTIYTTAYGETKKVVLPDHSVVILNANSTIKFRPDWGTDKQREIWLEGEAFFSVTHTQTHQKFVVHTSEHFNVEVLGTQFNVSNRTSRTRVVLNSGKIQLHIKEKAANAETKALVMKPGELVEFEKSPQQLTKKAVNPTLYSAWKDKRLVFEHTSLDELKTLLYEQYGLKVIATDPSLQDIRFNGDFPSDNLEMLLKALSATYDLKITTQANQIYLEPGMSN